MTSTVSVRQRTAGSLFFLFVTVSSVIFSSGIESTNAFMVGPSKSATTRGSVIPPIAFLRQEFQLCAASPASQQAVKPRNTKSKKRNKHSKKTKKNQQSTPTRPAGPGRSISQEELSDHVNSYIKNGHTDDNTVASSTQEYLKQLNSRPSLVLNADYQPMSYLPLSLWSWQDAVKAIFNGKVAVVDVYPDITVRAASIEVPLPSVIALTDYVPHTNTRPAFTRRNVFLRDEYKCQYCNERFHTADLSLDHVHPRSLGGRLSWENAVTSCLKCNGRKGSMPVSNLSSIGMKLLREPRCPTQMELAARAARMVPKRVHPTWKPYLGIAKRPAGRNEDGDEDFIDDRYFEASSD